jgi:hypothetical protein
MHCAEGHGSVLQALDGASILRIHGSQEKEVLETLLNKMEALINERGSAAVLREHLTLLRTRIGELERENGRLRAQAEQTQVQAQHQGDQLRRFAQDNPEGWRCDQCGSVDLVRTGNRPDPTFHVLGVKQAVMTCRVCKAVSYFAEG